jgi:hypothetical protein
MPARNFANYVFGELLKVNYVLVDGAPGLDQPINLSAAQPISSRQLYQLATELLIGVGLGVVEKEGVYFIGPADAKTGFGEVINLGSNFEISIKDTAQLISETMGVSIKITSDRDRVRPEKSEVERLWADTTKAKELISWEPSHAGREGFKRGLTETIRWFTKSENLSTYKSGIYNL